MRRATLAGLSTTAALLIGGAAPALAAKSPPSGSGKKHAHHHKRPFVAIEVGNRLSTTGPRFEDIYRVKKSPFGEGSVVRDAVLSGTAFPASGTATAKTYDRGGRTFARETFALGPPNTDGRGAITGNGTCRSGTGTHFGETCTYTLKGTYDLISGITRLTLTGTYTLGSRARPPK